MRNTTLFLSLIFLSISLFAEGQNTKRKDALELVNHHLSDQVQLKLRGSALLLRIDDDEGNYRADKVDCFELDPNSLYYDNNHQMIVVNCYEGECVERVMQKQKIKRYYKRFSIPADLNPHKVDMLLEKFKIAISP